MAPLTPLRRSRLPRLAIGLVGLFIIYSIIRNSGIDNNSSYNGPVDEITEFVQLDKEPIPIIHNKLSNKQTPHKYDEINEEFLKAMDKATSKCIDYVEYSQIKHAPFSQGKYEYPYMRPPPKCRTFTSLAVEKLIEDLKLKVFDNDLARLIENTLPNTLDTTILWHKSSLNNKQEINPQTFVVTGDIHAEWLRDAARQLSIYQPLIKHDNKLKELIKGAINTQAFYITISPYCNAFHPPPTSGVKKGNTAFDQVFPRPDWRQVFECKYEIDSLASFLTLTNDYYENSNEDLSFLNEQWLNAYEKLLIVFRRESKPSFDERTGEAMNYYYSFKRQTNIGSETLPLGGVGNPVNFGTGLIRSAFRPSDDATILQFFIPGNIHALTELRRARKNFLREDIDIGINISELLMVTDGFIKDIAQGIEKFGIVDHPIYGKVYAYEVDGYGGNIFMDDANIPSLLSIPDMGFTKIDDPIYQNTRKMILSKSGNPYYLQGSAFKGIGGPHIGIHNAWPMSLLVRIRTTNDDEEIKQSLKLVMETTAGLGLIHESVNVNSYGGRDFTRPWFAWCNSEFGKTILHLAKYKPHLIFKDEWSSQPYNIDAILSSTNPDN
ncbi:uncharacterized protein RJT21DRAFT_36131 [Scheffersomyces amazonensis]|uniref:uncharacterized protein n=1 Tax=Scheffersomyces amazonensis TaxID=1078765 RepID=UPI00315D9CF9